MTRGPLVRQLNQESVARRTTRRVLTVPAFFIAFVALLFSLPLTLTMSFVHGVVRRRGAAAVRAIVFLTVLFGAESVGVVCAMVLIVARFLRIHDDERSFHAFERLQSMWVRGLFFAATKIFSLRVRVVGDDCVRPGPVLVFIRHVSVADTLFPGVFIQHRHGIRLRYVLKEELLWDPCLDIVGQRLLNAFVRRGSTRTDDEIAKVRVLGASLNDDEGVLLFPEGTRFTPQKRARVLAALERENSPLLDLASSIRHALPPRLGGAQALMDTAPTADVVFCAHTGFEGVTTLSHLFDGTLVGRDIVVQFWRVPRAKIPDGDERAQWLHEEWRKIDDLVDAHGGDAHRFPAESSS